MEKRTKERNASLILMENNFPKRSCHKDDLRRRNLGVGIREKSYINKRVLFSDGFEKSLRQFETKEENKCPPISTPSSSSMCREIDNAVEEITSSSAKEQLLKLTQEEGKNRRGMKMLSYTRKRKSRKIMKNSSEEIMSIKDIPSRDDLAIVDSKRKDRKDSMKQKNYLKSKKNNEFSKHTTFVSNDNDFVSYTSSIQGEQNIDVVVIPDIRINDDRNNISRNLMSVYARNGIKPSKSALMFCRSNLKNDFIGSRSENKDKNGHLKKKKKYKTSGKIKYRLFHGKPAANFGIKKESENKKRQII